MANTHGLTPEEVLVALYFHAKPLGMGRLHYRPGGMTLDEAQAVLKQSTYVDYLRGRVIKVELAGVLIGRVSDHLYDRDNGQGTAQRALDDYFTATPENRDAQYHFVPKPS